MDFDILLKKITPALKAIARKNVLCGFHDADDLYQQMVMYLWGRFKDGMPIGMNEAYVIKACEFYLLNFLRKGRRAPSHYSLDAPVQDTDMALMDTLHDKKDMLSESESSINIDAIRKKNLTKRERQVLDMLLEGYTVREIAEKMGISHVMVIKYKKKVIAKSKV